MDAKRKAAYRSILYHFLLDIRTIPTPLTDDELAVSIGRYAGPVAYQLHKLALASAEDFISLNEAHFWASMAAFAEHNPTTSIAHYKQQFEEQLAAN